MKVEIDKREKEFIVAFFTTKKLHQYIKIWYKFGSAIYSMKLNFDDVKIYINKKEKNSILRNFMKIGA